ncbi:hypothetical protein [Streptomyces sp. NPDC051921]|uniref:hypothetical protein n=1 Tax=Streptomyces sp. NPDC051921 TaxID=3155806 RepID=UPI0034490DCD
MTFTVRPDQGEPGDFDLGDITCEGDCASVGSAGHAPDRGMMIYLSVPLLLDSLRPLITGEKKAVSFVGTDTSFGLDFKRDRKGAVPVSAKGTLLGNCTAEELAQAVLQATRELEGKSRSTLPPGGGARGDLAGSLERFRASIE